MVTSDLLSATGFRFDGRRFLQCRRVEAESDDVVRFRSGNTCVMARVFEESHLVPQQRTAVSINVTWPPFATPQRGGLRSQMHDRQLQQNVASAFENALQNKSNSSVTVRVDLTVLEADGGVLAACINATTLALSKEGYAMVDTPLATTIGYDTPNFYIDPTFAEQRRLRCVITIVFMMRSKGVVALSGLANLEPTVLKTLIDTAITTATADLAPHISLCQQGFARKLVFLRKILG